MAKEINMCEEIEVAILSDTELTQEQKNHIESCQSCKELLSEIEKMKTDLFSLSVPNLKDGQIADEVMKKINARAKPSTKIKWTRYCGTAAAAVIVVVAAVTISNRTPNINLSDKATVPMVLEDAVTESENLPEAILYTTLSEQESQTDMSGSMVVGDVLKAKTVEAETDSQEEGALFGKNENVQLLYITTDDIPSEKADSNYFDEALTEYDTPIPEVPAQDAIVTEKTEKQEAVEEKEAPIQNTVVKEEYITETDAEKKVPDKTIIEEPTEERDAQDATDGTTLRAENDNQNIIIDLKPLTVESDNSSGSSGSSGDEKDSSSKGPGALSCGDDSDAIGSGGGGGSICSLPQVSIFNGVEFLEGEENFDHNISLANSVLITLYPEYQISRETLEKYGYDNHRFITEMRNLREKDLEEILNSTSNIFE